MKNLLEVEHLEKKFPVRSGFLGKSSAFVQAVRDLSFSIQEGETLGLIGESGCGKTTLARLLVHLFKPDQGKILFEGQELKSLKGQALRVLRQKIQMIFQDPFASLNPRMSIGEILAEPLHIHLKLSRKEIEQRVAQWLAHVGLPDVSHRYPHEFSGGQRQRIGIARAMILMPKLVIADEPVSALDISIASQILELMKGLQRNSSYLFIAHDLRMVKYMSDRIAVMYLGKIVEIARRDDFEKPLHPYSQALVAAVPTLEGRKEKRLLLSGEVPSPVNPPAGCSFHPRCPYAKGRCREQEPALVEWKEKRWVACHYVDEINQS